MSCGPLASRGANTGLHNLSAFRASRRVVLGRRGSCQVSWAEI